MKMSGGITVRKWTPEDAEASYAVYYDAVRYGATDLYSPQQCEAWVPSPIVQDWWLPRLTEDDAWVTSDVHGLTGLIGLRPDGHLDLFFMCSRARGNGTAVRLYEALIRRARELGLPKLTTHASLHLRPFLEKRGWQVISTEIVTRMNVQIERFEMELPQFPSQTL